VVNEVEAVRIVLATMNEAGIPYVLSGSLASNFYAVPRSTKDADIIVETDAASLGRLFDRLSSDFSVDRQLRLEMVTFTHRYVMDHRASAFTIEFFLLSDDPFDKSRFARRRQDSYEGVPVWVLTPEDVVVQKLRWLRISRNPKHRDDVRRVLIVSGPTLDYEYMYPWTDQHETRALFDEIRQEVERVRPQSNA